MKTIVNTYSNSTGSITHYSVREWSINVYAVERFVLESKLTDEQNKVLSQSGVYILVNEKCAYIGQSQNILERWKQHIGKEEKDWFNCAYAITDEADMNISNLDSKEIKISLLAGSVNLSLLRIPERESRISSKFGNLNIFFPKDESYTINARSFYSKFINNLNGSVTDWIREGKTYKHNGGGVEIMLQTHNGDIEIRE